MSVSPISTTPSATAAATAATLKHKTTLDTQDFIKLLNTQLQAQDPLKPMDDTAFVAQMAQFTSLSQTQTMASDIASLRADQQKTAAVSYIGSIATVKDSNGQTVTGQVTAVDTSGSSPRLLINNQLYDLSTLSLVTWPTREDLPATGS